MSEINHENVLIQLKDALNRNSIKLWEEPYCVLGESNDSEIVVSELNFLLSVNAQFCCFFVPISQNLANILCQQLNLKYEYCFAAISELQNTALDNLKSIDEFNSTGKIN